ncbi:MAG: DUF6870 family protein [Anaerorhabdus sp.]
MQEELLINLKNKLEVTKNISIDDVDINTLEDISNIKISKKKDSNERIVDFINSIDNPYLFKVNNVVVKIEFSNNSNRAEDCINNVIKSLYK